MAIFILRRYLLRLFIPTAFGSLLFFTLFVETLDIFVNLLRYLFEEVPWRTILKIQYLHLPQSISYALPVALLFSVSFTMSSLYSNNELIAVYASGISLIRFVVPLLLLGLLLGIGNFFFKEYVVIETVKQKNDLTRISLNKELAGSNENVAVIQGGGKILYRANFYDDADKSLSDVIVIETNLTDHSFVRRIDASRAVWDETQWMFYNVKVFQYAQPQNYQSDSLEISQEPVPISLTLHDTFSDPAFNFIPSNFRNVVSNVDEMRYAEAFEYVRTLKENGLSYRKVLTDTHGRIPLSISPFIVVVIACFAANAYGKNTFFVSLLMSLIMAVVYYSIDLIGSILASRFVVSPFIGAWLSTIVILLFSILLYKKTSR